jgi:hypothetical protein
MHPWPRLFLLSSLVGALVLLGENTTMAQAQPAGVSSPPPPPGYGYPPPAPGYVSPPAPGYGYPPPVPGYGYASPAPGYHQHDGFYMRLALGGGYLNASSSYEGSKTILSGGALALSFAFGGAVIPNLIVYGEVVGMSVPDPSRSANGSSGTMSGTTLYMVGVGPGVAYYLEPMNMYFSGTLTFSRVNLSNTNTNEKLDETNLGFGFSLMAGKEWWVSTDWGLGAAAQFQFASMKLRNLDARMTGLGLGLLFSATYN